MAYFKKVIRLAVIMLAPLLLAQTSMFGNIHIRVLKQINFEQNYAVRPTRMAATNDAGYVIVGTLFSSGWATRLDKEGGVVWRHVSIEPPIGSMDRTYYTGVVMLRDDSTIICGYRNARTGTHLVQVGVLLHISASGAVLYEQEIFPADDQTRTLSYLTLCAPVENQVFALGHTYYDVNGNMQGASWEIVLDEHGEIKKNQTKDDFVVSGLTQSMTSRGSHLYFLGVSREDPYDGPNKSKIHVVRMNAKGEKSSEFLVPEYSIFLEKNGLDQDIEVINENPFKPLQLTKKSGNADGVVSKIGFAPQIQSKRSFQLPDGSIAEFGLDYLYGGGMHLSAVGWISADRTSSEHYIFSPSGTSYGIADALPTRDPRVFATVRSFHQNLDNEIVMGRASGKLAFVEFN